MFDGRIYVDTDWACGASRCLHGDELELFGNSEEEAAPLAPLGGTNADAAAVADLILFVEQVQHVGADRQRFERARAIEILGKSGVHDEIARKRAAVGHDSSRILGAQARGVNEV